MSYTYLILKFLLHLSLTNIYLNVKIIHNRTVTMMIPNCDYTQLREIVWNTPISDYDLTHINKSFVRFGNTHLNNFIYKLSALTLIKNAGV